MPAAARRLRGVVLEMKKDKEGCRRPTMRAYVISVFEKTRNFSKDPIEYVCEPELRSTDELA